MEESPGLYRGGRQIQLEDGSQSFVTLQTATKELQAFDLNPKFGPFMNRTRQERITRLEALDLSAPHRILEILHALPELPTPDESWLGFTGGDKSPSHVLGGPATRSHEELGHSNAIYHSSQGDVPKISAHAQRLCQGASARWGDPTALGGDIR